ncbi:conjugal transfer protein TraG N-terminal domain-containing protein [Sulfurospirillum multivorans]|uniref:TraG_N family protein n=2 Tax=Sulfurospirillum multivorans TaxID=66821 RepID=A0AA86AKM7_SULMK|nr:conjugal transfer protein TraG N-terminal domain-containing protein [Sulfurospirillum multivorans]AHJ11317.1 TraG_N family protein [Sulfurospirillum multivorans DSM 12446]QEH04821.1 TraG_N family protein [Sulfurospirillum multivorans]
MIKVISILCLFSLGALADDYLVTVSSAEEVDSMFSILNAVAMIFHSEDYLSLLKLVALFGSVFVFINAITGKLGTEGLKSFSMYQIFVVGVLSVVFSVSSTVYIKTDNYPLYYDNNTTITTGTAVANIPTVLAYSYSFFNSFGNGLTNLFQTAMSYSGSGNYSLASGGYVSSLRDSIDILNHKFNDSSHNFGNDVERFVADCILVPFSGKGDEGQKRIDELYSSTSIKSTLDSWYSSSITVGNIPVNSYTASVNGDVYECGALWTKLSSNDLTSYKDTMSKVFKNVDDRDVEVITKQTSLPKSNFEELAIQSGLINSFLSNSKLPTGIAYAERKTRAEYIQTNLASGYYMSKMLPILQVVLRGLLYALFPLIVVIGLINGISIFKNYAKALVWIEMWGVCASILNFFILKYAENSFGGDVTAYNSMQMLSDSAAMAGVAGYLYVSVPMISWGLMSGSFTMLSSIASNMTQSLSKNLSAMSISSDSKALQLKESVSQSTGKDLSYAEALHYQNIQAGTKEGIEIGTNLNQGANFQNKLNYDSSKPYNELSAKMSQVGSLSNVLSQEGKKSSLDFAGTMGSNSLLTSQTAYGAGREGVRQMEAKAGMETKFGSKLTEDSFTRANEWNDPTILDTLETVNLVDNDQIKYQEEKVIPWQINYTQTSSNKRLSTKLSKMVIPLKILHKDWECILIRSKHG